MAKLSEIAQSTNLKLLLLGDSGAGKTTFAASGPGRVQIADFDGKVSSAAQYLRENNPSQLDQVNYTDYASIGKFGDKELAAHKFNQDMGQLAKDLGEVRTFVLDSLTTFSDASMEYLLKSNPGVKRFVTQGAQIPVLQDYQMARIWFKQMLTALLSLKCHVIVTAHIQVDKDELTGQIIRSPMMAGKLSRELPIYFEEVWRAYRDERGEYWAQTQSDRSFVCRSQIPGLPNPVKLDWNEINKYLTKGETK